MSLGFCLSVSSHQSAAERAYAFAQQLMSDGHQIHCVFIHDAGVQLAQDTDHTEQWSQLALKHSFPLVLCSQAAAAHDIQQSALVKPFEIDSLMRLLEAERTSDRVVNFHN